MSTRKIRHNVISIVVIQLKASLASHVNELYSKRYLPKILTLYVMVKSEDTP